MPAKHRCKHCKEYFPKEDLIKTHKGKFCSAKHIIDHGEAMKRKAKDREARQMKQRFYENDIKTRKAAAVREFNSYIRVRDAGKPCISCGLPIDPADYAAGHFVTSGSNSLLRFDEVNVNGQHNTRCNSHLSGDIKNYRIGLVERWGQAELERLENTKGTIKRTAQDYKQIELTYRAKRRALEEWVDE